MFQYPPLDQYRQAVRPISPLQLGLLVITSNRNRLHSLESPKVYAGKFEATSLQLMTILKYEGSIWASEKDW